MRALQALLLAGAIATVALWLALARPLPLLEIRSQPLESRSGCLLVGHSTGQGFLCPAGGLARIEVCVAQQGPFEPADVELRLRLEHPRGEIVRRAPGLRIDLQGWLAFELEPLPDSAGKSYFFELAPAEGRWIAQVSPFVRFRGLRGARAGGWQPTSVAGQLDFEIESSESRLSGLAIAFDRLERGEMPPVLEVRAAVGEGAVLARAEGPLRAPLLKGQAFFCFEPLPDSRRARYRICLSLPRQASLPMNPDGPAFQCYHGLPAPVPSLPGATQDGVLQTDRDLVFRVASSGTAWSDSRALLHSRLGSAGWVALLLWILAAGLALKAALRR